MKHTPGPWKVDGYGFTVLCEGESPTHDYDFQESNEICVLDDAQHINYKNQTLIVQPDLSFLIFFFSGFLIRKANAEIWPY